MGAVCFACKPTRGRPRSDDGPEGSPAGPATLRIQARVTNLGEDPALAAIRGEAQTQILTSDGDHEVSLPSPRARRPLLCGAKLCQHLGDEVTPRTPVPNPRLRLDEVGKCGQDVSRASWRRSLGR